MTSPTPAATPTVRVDLYSDTNTRPTPAMRRFMAEAEVGNEQEREDPTVNRLQEMTAELLGKEAALFLPSGTMCNQIAFSVWCRPGDEIIMDESAHPIHYEAGGPAAITGAMVRALQGERGIFSAAQVRSAIRPREHFYPRTRVVSIEQTANMTGGVCWRQDQIEAVGAIAHEHDLRLHMDGARLLNATTALGTPAARLTAACDSCWLDLTKGLGAPVGAVLAGSREFIEEAWVFKQRFGGAMRQAGIIAAGGIYALQNHVTRLAEDHANARVLAEGLSRIPGIRTDPALVQTNIVIFDVSDTGLDGEGFVHRTLAGHGVRFSVVGGPTVRAVTHLDVSRAGIDTALVAAAAAARATLR
jgi:threonine aldolase